MWEWLCSCFTRLKQKTSRDYRSKYIFYKLVDSEEKPFHFRIQCINKRATAVFHIRKLVNDSEILYGFHPTQAAYIGLQYAKYLRNSHSFEDYKQNNFKKPLKSYPMSRYGKYALCYIDRSGEVGFIEKATKKEFHF